MNLGGEPTAIGISIDVLLVLAFYLPMASGTLFILPIACMGVGSYASAELALHGQGLPVVLAGGAASGLVLALLGGLIVVRMAPWSGAIASLAMVEVLQTVFSNSKEIGGSVGLLGVPPYTSAGVCYALAAVAVVVLVVLELNRFGDILEAMRGDPVAAESSGIRLTRVRMTVYGASGVLAGLSGALSAGFVGIVDPAGFGLEQVNRALIAVVLGGDTTAIGSLVGGGVLNLVPQFFTGLAESTLLILSIVVIVVLILRPDGIVSRRLLKRGLGWVSRRLGRGGSGRTGTSRGYARHLAARPKYDVLTAKGMTKRYAGLEVVSGVDLEVRAGEVLGIVGANGAGKTTLIDLITGVTRADDGLISVGQEGTVRRRMKRIKATPAVGMGMSRTFQSGRLFPGLSAREHVSIIRGADPERLLELVGFDATADGPATELSYGDQRLVGIARALGSDPRFLLLDEPTAGMTSEEARGVAALIERISGEGIGVIVIDHNVEFIAKTCGSIMFMNFGKVLARGEPAAVLREEAVIKAYFGDSEEQLMVTSRSDEPGAPAEPADDGREIVEEIITELRD
jgi:branched-chain amino acid transport system permease protein